MNHHFIENWNWYEIETIEKKEEAVMKMVHILPDCARWMNDISEDTTNYLRIENHGDSVLNGCLLYEREDLGEVEYDNDFFYFYVTKNYFVTVGLDIQKLKRMDKKGMLGQMHQCGTAAEGFFILLGEILNNYLDGIDEFEHRLKTLQRDLKKNNNKYLLDRIYDLREELLIWTDLTIPVEEIKLAAEEAFLDGITETKEFRRTSVRIDRTLNLIRHYKQDIDTMINLEEVLSSHRGNEIMKTLTVMTVIFTPGMMLGSIWGMNFKNMPELDWKTGYFWALGLIGLSILSIYLWLRMKGWTGDLLESRSKKHRFK
ncbi:magnesium transporter CorA family protein [Fictibacillus terranigra]|uniref:Magnesium transporter CorA family protein n=1 Tax=Fictibacillus terranigra TaxID=3058424 RepID=A0ABT8EDY0_9BACL|nr:magnesium transporter CorA family protein [Fictibacillus sp. CENA-BCM004]MDN4076124.1 magnesium transporter CorA family protein [Fictibacillus sp. CENA-BCM004]